MDNDVKHLKQNKGVNVEPLYKNEDVPITMEYIYEHEEGVMQKLSENISFKLLRNNHVLSSTSLELFFKDDSSRIHKLYYSSDLGTNLVDKYFVFDKIDKCTNCNLAILESTYNSKDREAITKKARKEELKLLEDTIVNTIINKKGNVVMPCFSADRTQNMLVHLKNIWDKHKELEDVVIYVDGKLTAKVMKIYSEILEGEQKELFDSIFNWKNLKIVSDFMTGTRMILGDKEPHLTISSSGMADKGHVLEHIKASVKSSKDVIVFTGYSSPTSLASRLKEKIINPNKKNILIEKTNYCFNCEVVELKTFSSHIQRQELINLIKEMNVTDKIILVHGEQEGRKDLAKDAMEECMKINKTTRVISAERNMRIEF
jgi:predicted metal-dependent RNase